MYVKANDRFEIEWDDPADAALTWTFDQVHFPRPLPQLSAQLMATIYLRIVSAPARFANGYGFFYNLTVPPPTPEIFERGVVDVWENDYLPRIRDYCQRVRSTDYDGMSAAELVDVLRQNTAESTELFRLTLVVVFAFMGPTLGFVQFLEDELGADGPVLAATALQGYENDSAAAGVGLGELAREAEKHPAVAEALRAGRTSDLAAVAGGPAFLEKLQAYLDEFGWRVESWSLVHEPTWAENPAVPLGLIARYLRDPALSPAASVGRSAGQRDEAIRQAEARLAPEKRAAFRAMLDGTRAHVGISEGRALWQLILVGVFRRPALALGRKLVAAGAIEDANDVFFLDFDELGEAVARPAGPWKATVRSRKDDLARFEKLEPPPFIGAPPDMAAVPPEMIPVFRHFFGLGVVPSGEARVVTGNAASDGVARGRAKVIRSLAEADRFEAGDVLVCATTAPPWTPLFAVASAVVTDSGGVLSHSAICAREFAIPCVVGTMVGTRVIPDGAMVTVDGRAGTVTIES